MVLSTSELDKYLTFSCSNTRSSSSLKIAKPFSRTIILKYSFWRRYIYIWNSLPNSVVGTQSLKSFKKGLMDHLFK